MTKFVGFVAAACFLLLASCGGAKYADLKDTMDKMVKSSDKFITEAGKASDAKSTSAALSAYAEDIKANGKAYSDVLTKYADDFNDPKTTFAPDVKAVKDKFDKIGPSTAPVIEKIVTTYPNDAAINDNFHTLYLEAINTIAKMVATVDKFVSDMNAAKDGKSVASIVTAFTTESKKNDDYFRQVLRTHPELGYLGTPPSVLEAPTNDLGSMNDKITTAMGKLDTFKDDADVQKALAARYEKLGKSIKTYYDDSVKFVDSMKKANDAKAIAASLNAFYDAVTSYQKDVSSEVGSLPELQVKGIDGLPKDLSDVLTKLGTMNTEITDVLSKVDKYKDDPAVKEAMEKLQPSGQ